MKKLNSQNKISKMYSQYGPWALVTGGSDGIGKDFVFELAKNGFSLVVVARSKNVLENLQSEVSKKYDVLVEAIDMDLSQQSSLEKLHQITKSKDIGLAVLAAGFGSGGEFINLPIESELNMVDLNCRTCVQISHDVLGQFQRRKKSGLILFGSLVGFQGAPFSATYSATKAFIQSFAEALHHEVKSKGIDVLSVAPGPISTGFGKRAGMKMSMSQNSKGIAKICLSALGHQTTIRPGFLSKFLGYSLITLPRFIRTRIMKQIMSGMVH